MPRLNYMKGQRKSTRRGVKRSAPATAVVTTSGVKTIPKVSKLNQQSTVATVGMVKRLLGKARENKMISRRPLEAVSFNSTVTTDAYPLLPQIPLGTEDYERIGDSVQPKALYIKGDIGLNGTTQLDNKPIIARVMILEQRDIKSEGSMTLFQYDSLLKVNDPTTSTVDKPYDTLPSNNLLPINKTLFKVHYDRKFYLAPTVDDVSIEERTKQKRFFTCKIRCPKNLYWDSGAAINPNFCKNFCPFLVIGYQYADDTGGDVITTRVIANARSFLYYEDA